MVRKLYTVTLYKSKLHFIWLGLWRLAPLSSIYQLYRGSQFYWRRTNFYTYIGNSQVVAIRDQKNVRKISNLGIKFKTKFICAAMTVTSDQHMTMI